MTLGELIERFERLDPSMVFKYGITHPHSYRGYYDQLAFEPISDSKVSTMLDLSREAVGKTYTGYKGGDYTMDLSTEVNIAEYGDCGDPLTPAFFDINILAAENAALRAENKRLRGALVKAVADMESSDDLGTGHFDAVLLIAEAALKGESK